MTEQYSATSKPRSTATVREALEAHIESGITLLQNRQGLTAYEHFQSSFNVPGLESIDVHGGMIFPVWKLLDTTDLVSAASTVARHSRAGQNYAEIAGWHTGSFTTDYSDTTKYDPNIVDQFHQEAGTVAAEEWVHILQHVVNRPLAGKTDCEVDVAAYFAEQDIDLSTDFLTRYPARYNWYAAIHPERTEELQGFSRQFGRRILTSE